MASNLPIGIFDSGVGGLTVVREIIKTLPNENLIYLGDTGRVPYGTRDNETINKFTGELVSFMLRRQVKAIVVACNTMSAVSLTDVINATEKIPIIDVISPTVEFVSSQKGVSKVGVIGTRATINSREYENQIETKNNKIKVFSKACPLFVSLVEEGFSDSEAALKISDKYLDFFDDKKLDMLILGCTHYPMLKEIISQSLRRRIKIIDSALPTAQKLKNILIEKKLLNSEDKKPEYNFYVTDSPLRSLEIANIFFEGKFPGKIEKITLV